MILGGILVKKLFSLLLASVMLASSAMAAETVRPSGVTYEIFVGSFRDSNGDGIGDLGGIAASADYIASLGADRVWLTPVHPSISYHKYDVLDYYDIDPQFGTLDDFDAMEKTLEERGIAVTMDLVVNHTSSEHPWFLAACDALRNGTDSPYIDWYHFTKGEGQHIVTGTDWYYEGQFGYHMPDLNLGNPDVRKEIAAIIAFWQGHGVDGFRLDAVTSYYTGAPASTTEFLAFVTETAHAGDPDCWVVGEAWTNETEMLQYYASGVDSLFYFPGADSTGRFVKGALNANGAAVAAAVADWQARLHDVSPASQDAPFLTNHDMARARGMLRSKIEFQKVAAMTYLLTPGRPVVYYGEELGMSGSGIDENKRLPMLWNGTDASAQCAPPAAADQQQRLKEGVCEQEGNPDSLLNWYRDVIALRSLAPELTNGTMTAVDAGHKAIGCWRVDDGGESVIVIVNTSVNEAVTVDVAAMGKATPIGSCGMTEDCILQDNDGYVTMVTLPAISCLVLDVQ